jgi:hypothetical protein
MEIAAPRPYRDFDEYWDSHITGPIAASFASLADAKVEQIRESLAAVLADFRSDGGLEIPSLVVGASAERDRDS